MKTHFLSLFQLILKIYASYVLGLTLLLLPVTIFGNQTLVYSISPALFSSSILQQNVLDALRIVLLNSSTSTYFVQSEVRHLQDVHVLFVTFYLVGLIVLIFNFTIFKKRQLSKRFLVGGVIGIITLSVLGGLFFATFFEVFHQILFPQGNFAFPYDSMLIQTFPPLFWLLQFLELQVIAVLSLLIQLRAANRQVF